MSWIERHVAWRFMSTKVHEAVFMTRDTLRARVRTHHRKARDNAIAIGDCGVCCKRPKDEGYATCTECRAYNRDLRARQRRERGVPERQFRSPAGRGMGA